MNYKQYRSVLHSAAGAVAALAPLCHGAPSCRLTADPALLGLPACQDIHVSLKIAFACVQRNNFLPQFIRKQESTILEAKPGPDLGSELSLGSDKSNHPPHSAPDPTIHPTSSSPPSQVGRPAASEAEVSRENIETDNKITMELDPRSNVWHL